MPKIEEIYWRAECSFAESHKHGALAKAIKVSWAESVGIVAALYGQVRRQLPDGDLSRIADDVLQRWCHSRKVTRAALIESGWVDGDGIVRGWDERYSDIAEKRAAERDKKRKQRSGHVPEMSRDCPPNVPAVPSLRAFTREGEGKGEVEKGKAVENANVGGRSGSPTTAPAALPSPLFKIYHGKAARTNVLRRSDELRTTLGERLAPFADRVAEVIAARAERASNPESYTTSAVKQPWVREIASAIEAHDAEERDRLDRAAAGGGIPVAPMVGGAQTISLSELLKLIPGGVS